MSWIIYCHIHIESQRRYIGLTKKTIHQRWREHCIRAESHFSNAIRKYGEDAFEHYEFAQKYDTIEDANRAEEFAIEFWCTKDPEFGFNIMNGGFHIPHSVKKNHWDDPSYRAAASARSKEINSRPITKMKISAALTGRKMDQGHKDKISVFQKQYNEDPVIRNKRSLISRKAWSSPGFREKQSLSHMGKVTSPETRRKLSEVCKSSLPEIRAKISASSKSNTPEARENYRIKLLEFFRKKREQHPNYHMCKNHGLTLFSDCYKSFRNGYTRYTCKKCALKNGQKYRSSLIKGL